MRIRENPRIAIAGSVNSSERVLRKLIEHNMNIQWVLGLNPTHKNKISGYKDLKPVIEFSDIDFNYFDRVNDDWVIDGLKCRQIDLFFVVGLSQLIKKEVLDVPRICCIGYHPTALPKGRGRAALAWILQGKVEPAVTFFRLDERADGGDIIIQKPLRIKGTEYPQELINILMREIDNAMDTVLPMIKAGGLPITSQNEKEATYLGKRAPSDGFIEWKDSAEHIEQLIRSVSYPLPGAITFKGEREVIIWKSRLWEVECIVGVPGRIVKLLPSTFVVSTGNGLLEIIEWEGLDFSDLIEGQLLGINWVVLYRKFIKNV